MVMNLQPSFLVAWMSQAVGPDPLYAHSPFLLGPFGCHRHDTLWSLLQFPHVLPNQSCRI